jgi:hypothetical protein
VILIRHRGTSPAINADVGTMPFMLNIAPFFNVERPRVAHRVSGQACRDARCCAAEFRDG